MRTELYARFVGMLLLALALLMPLARSADDAILQTGKISYVSGGVGEESKEKLKAVAKDFNLKLVFSLESGAYVSAVQVDIMDAAGISLVQTTSEGPLFLAKLPSGTYKVSATLGAKKFERKVSLAYDKQKVFYFRWASE